MTEGEAASLKHTARATFDKSMDVIVDIFVPLGTGIAGILAGSTIIGGTYSIANAVNSGGQGNLPGNRIGGAIAAGIFAVIGMAFWRLGHQGGFILKIIGKGVGGLFLGCAIQSGIRGALLNQTMSQGPLDKLFEWVQSTAGGG